MALSLMSNKNKKDDKDKKQFGSYQLSWIICPAAFPSLLLLHSHVHTVTLPINLPTVNK